MTDLSQTIIPKSDQLNSDDLITGPRTVRITKVTANLSSPEQPISVFFDGDEGKPYKPCKSMRRVMVHLWGANGAAYSGRSMTLYRDESVKWGGIEIGGIRISHASDIERPVTIALTATRASRKPYTVSPLARNVAMPDLTAASPAAIDLCATAAGGGMAVLQQHWQSLPNPLRAILKPRLDEWKRIAAEADAAISFADPETGELPPDELPEPGAYEAYMLGEAAFLEKRPRRVPAEIVAMGEILSVAWLEGYDNAEADAKVGKP